MPNGLPLALLRKGDAGARLAVRTGVLSARVCLSASLLSIHCSLCLTRAKLSHRCRTQVREGAERAIATDPGEDLAYHMLGRWHNEIVRD